MHFINTDYGVLIDIVPNSYPMVERCDFLGRHD